VAPEVSALQETASGEAGTLYVVATPIGNLEDLSERALRILGEADLVLAEDTRRLRKILTTRGLRPTVKSYHGDTSATKRERILKELAEGACMALVTEAGTPGLSDPGAQLVAEAAQRGVRVVPIPGPSAITTALSVSGLPGQAFEFAGYAPRQTSERREFLRRVAASPVTSIFFEAPHRLVKCLRDLAEVASEEQQLVICRELTKLHEEILRTTVGEARAHFEAQEPRGEFTLLLPPDTAAEEASGGASDEDLRAAGARLLELGLHTGEAAQVLALATGRPRNEMYEMLLELREDS